jgi:hypothetical protein
MVSLLQSMMRFDRRVILGIVWGAGRGGTPGGVGRIFLYEYASVGYACEAVLLVIAGRVSVIVPTSCWVKLGWNNASFG